MNEKEKKAYSAKVWQLQSPNARYYAVIAFDKVVSLEYMESHFKGGWHMAPLFPNERNLAQKKADKARRKSFAAGGE